MLVACGSPPVSPEVKQARAFTERQARCLQRGESAAKAQQTAQAASQRRVIANVRRAEPDPARDALRAAKLRDWGLIRSYGMIGTFAYGVECRDGTMNMGGKPLVAAYRVVSDVPGSCETFGSNADCAVDTMLDRYAPAYNRALVSHPAYPYRDFCRLPESGAAGRRTPSFEGPLDINDFGFRPLVDPAHPRTAAEAARRGNVEALARFAADDRRAATRPDAFGMTPLTWAVAYRQPAAVKWLASHGAEGDGGECGQWSGVWSPFRLALQTGQDEAAELLHLATPADRRTTEWDDNDLRLAASGGAVRFLARMLHEPNTGVTFLEPQQDRPFHPLAARMIADAKAARCWRTPIPEQAEIQLISVSEGRKPASATFPNTNTGNVSVEVAAGPRPKLLVLSSSDETRWTLRMAPGAQVVGVLMIGYNAQHLTGAPARVPVVANWYRNFCAAALPNGVKGAGSDDPDGLVALQSTVRSLLGRAPDGVQSDYTGTRFRL